MKGFHYASQLTVADGLEAAEHGHGQAKRQAEDPNGDDHLVRVRSGLPDARLQRPADGKVALERDGHQRPHADGHRDGYFFRAAVPVPRHEENKRKKKNKKRRMS